MKKRRKPIRNYRPGIELLEDRIVPSTFSRVADLDATAADFDLNGDYEYLETDNEQLYISDYPGSTGNGAYESRGVMEFNISAIPSNAQITSVRLYGEITAIFADYPQTGVDVEFRFQWGDGVIEGI